MSFHKQIQPHETDPNSSDTIAPTIGDLEKGGYAVLEGHPCQIKQICAKHSHIGLKGIVTGINIFTNKEHSQFFGVGEKIEVPILERKEYQLLDIDNDNFVVLMDEDGTVREDLRLLKDEGQEELIKRIRKSFEAQKDLLVSVLGACGKEVIMDFKESN